MLKIITLSIFLTIFLTINLYSDTIPSLRRPTVVIGFQSKLPDDPTAGNWFTRVTIREMQKIPVIRTPSAENVALVIKQLGYSTEQTFILTNAANIAKIIECSQFILGVLEPDDKTGKVKVRFQLYDALDLEPLVDDTVIVNSGVGLYDALDKFQKEIVGSLFDANTLPAKLGLSITTGKALVSVNDGEIKEVEKNYYVWLRMRPGSRIRIKYYDFYTKMLLFSTNLVLKPDSEQALEYKPTANLQVEGLPGARIVKSDGSIIVISSNGFIKTPLNALVKDSVLIETREKRYKLDMVANVNSELNIASIKTDDPRKIDYSNSFPLLNLVVPGFAQYQANDYFLGSFFTLLALSGGGLSAFGFYAEGQMAIKASQTDIPEDIRKFNTYGELYRSIAYTGIGLWVLSAIVSCAYSFWHPTRFIDPLLPESPLSFYLDSCGFGMNLRLYLS